MANAKRVSNLAVVVSADTTGVTQGLERAKKSVDNFSAGLMGGAIGGLMGGKVGGVGGLIGGLIGGPAGAAGGAAIGTAIDSTFGAIASSISTGAGLVSTAVKSLLVTGAEFEMAIASFSAATGSDALGKQMFKGINNLAAGTIFSSDQLAKQAQMLLGYGMAADKVIPSLTKLALVSQKTGRGEEGLGRLSLAFGQSMAAGRLRGNELNQFTEAGLGPNEFAKTMGVSTERLRDLVEAGQVGFDVVAKTMDRVGSESEALAEKLNKTLTGAFNALKDTGLIAMGEAGMAIAEAFKLPEGLRQIAAYLQDLPAKVQQLTPQLEKIRTLLEPIGKGIYSAFSIMLDAGTQFVSGVLPSMKDAKSAAEKLGESIAVGMGTAVDYAIDFGIEFTKSMTAASKSIRFLMDDFEDIKHVVDALIFLQEMTPAAVLQRNLGGSKGNPQTQFEEAMDNMLQGFRTAKEGGSYADKAKKAFAAGFPAVATLDTKFDQRGNGDVAKGLSPAIRELTASIKDNALNGKGLGPFSDFQTSFGNLMAVERNGSIQTGAERAAADAFLYGEFKKLTGSMSKLENVLPAAIDRNTVEGQARIEKVISNMQMRGTDDVPGLLRQAAETARQQLQEQKRTVDELRRIGPQIPINVG